MREPGWAVVVPVKRLATAKTRLRGGAPPGVPHARLVLAMAQDTVRAALACPVVAEVVVVTGDPAVAAALGELGARVVPEPPPPPLPVSVPLPLPVPPVPPVPPGGPGSPDGPDGPDGPDREGVTGLNRAVGHGAGQLAGAGRWLAALAADLPALRPDELARALRAAAHPRPGSGPRRGFVPDAGGTGTTLLAAPPGVPLAPRFGPGSAARHAASGARRLDGDWPSLRRDVDTAADLAAAERLGLGPSTAARLRETVR
jgi:2-phospho-L-lactate guanylyltransferase